MGTWRANAGVILNLTVVAHYAFYKALPTFTIQWSAPDRICLKLEKSTKRAHAPTTGVTRSALQGDRTRLY